MEKWRELLTGIEGVEIQRVCLRGTDGMDFDEGDTNYWNYLADADFVLRIAEEQQPG